MNQKEKRLLKLVIEFVACCSVVICAVIFLFFRSSVFAGGWRTLINILMPFIYGAVIAYLLRPIALSIERLLIRVEKRIMKKEHPGTRRLVSILLALVLMLLLLILLLMLVLPEVINSISGLLAQLPGVLQSFEDWIAHLDSGEMSHEAVVYIQQTVDTLTGRLESFLQTDLLPNLMNLVSSVTSSFGNILSVLGNFFLGCIIASYLMGGWEKFVAQAKLIVYALFRKDIADWIKKEVKLADHLLSGFINGKILDSLIIGIICFAFCTISKMPYTVLVSVIVGVTNVIPFFGPYLGAIPSALLILTVSPVMSIVFLVFVVILQQFDGNFLGPKILGDKLGLSSFWILFAILVAGKFWGVVGMLLGAPLFALFYSIFRDFIYKLLGRRGQEQIRSSYEQTFHKEEIGKRKEVEAQEE